MLIHGKEYAEVKDRIKQFRKDNPDWSITTELLHHAPNMEWVFFKAVVADPAGTQMFTGHAFEERTSDVKEVNFTSWVENCETSAIGRVLANMSIQLSDQRPSAEEMQKVERMKASPATPTVTKTPFLRKKIEQGPTKSATDSAKGDVMRLKGALTHIMGHDLAFQQALMNRNLESLDQTITLVTLEELRDSLASFLAYIEDRLLEILGEPGKTMRDLAVSEQTELAEALKKMTLVL
jgi:hypothetical protein